MSVRGSTPLSVPAVLAPPRKFTLRTPQRSHRRTKRKNGLWEPVQIAKKHRAKRPPGSLGVKHRRAKPCNFHRNAPRLFIIQKQLHIIAPFCRYFRDSGAKSHAKHSPSCTQRRDPRRGVDPLEQGFQSKRTPRRRLYIQSTQSQPLPPLPNETTRALYTQSLFRTYIQETGRKCKPSCYSTHCAH